MGTAKSGNRTFGRAALIGNEGNRAPMHLRSIPLSTAENKVVPQYNAEATYNDWANKKAAGHLSELHQHLNNLWETTQNRSAYLAKQKVADLHQLHQQVRFAAHPDIISGIEDIKDRLHNIDPMELPGQGADHHTHSLEAAYNFTDTFTPAAISTYKEHGSSPNEASVVVDSEYRKNIFADPKTTADGRYYKTAQYEAAKKAKGYKKPPKQKMEN
jgi:hypothetical protein